MLNQPVFTVGSHSDYPSIAASTSSKDSNSNYQVQCNFHKNSAFFDTLHLERGNIFDY